MSAGGRHYEAERGQEKLPERNVLSYLFDFETRETLSCTIGQLRSDMNLWHRALFRCFLSLPRRQGSEILVEVAENGAVV
jgi:hypothetical protein